MKEFFSIRYEFDREAVLTAIDERLRQPGSDYICVADGVILANVTRFDDYRHVVNSGMFAICDSSYVPIYIKLMYNEDYGQYCGSEIFSDIVGGCRHRMIFLGAQRSILDSLQRCLAQINPAVKDMRFVELPFCSVDEFDYEGIARMIEEDGADIVWVSLGAPKQEYFMHRLQPHLGHGVMIAVGAAFKFFSGKAEKRAPQWMRRRHMEFLYRIWQQPGKQLRRCGVIAQTLPQTFWRELRRKQQVCR